MRSFSLPVLALLLCGLIQAPATATELGTAGPIRSFGGSSLCEPFTATSDEACHLPPVDASAPAREQSRQQVARALRLLDVLHVSDAETTLDLAVKLDPTNVIALSLRGRLALTDAQPALAEPYINAALALAPDDAGLIATKAYLESDPATMGQALVDANRAVQLSPDDADIRWIRSTLHVLMRQFDLAFADLTFILAKQPGNIDARRARAQILLQRRDYPAAMHDAAQLLDRAPRDIAARQIRAEAAIAAGDDAAALADLDVVVGPSPEAAPRRATPFFQGDMIKRAGVLVRLQRKIEAKTAIDDLVAQGGVRSLLRLQVYLHGSGFPNVAIKGKRSDAFDTALAACFADRTCGPRLQP